MTGAETHEARHRAWNVFTGAVRAPLGEQARILTSAPVSGLVDDADLHRHITGPLADGLLDAVWRPDVLLAGTDGDDLWTAHTGTMAGLFVDTLWGIPPSGRHAEIRYGEFTRLVGGEVVELRVLADLPGLAAQSGWHLFGPTELADGGWSGRPVRDLDPSRRPPDEIEAERTAALLGQLTALPPSDQDTLFHEGARRWRCHGLAHVPTAQTVTAPADVSITDGEFAAACHWPDDDDGGVRSMSFYVRDGDRFAASWLLVDLVHAVAQQGGDLLARS